MATSFFDYAEITYYPSVGLTILGCYLTAVLVHIIAIAFIMIRWKKLPITFRVAALVCTISIFLGFTLCIIYLTTLKTLNECTTGRKILYTLFYLGFVVYDMVSYPVC